VGAAHGYLIRPLRGRSPHAQEPQGRVIQIVAVRKKRDLDELSDILFRIKRGLAGYVSYLAACEMNQAFSEYVLYEPILRILTARGYDVECEVPCPGLPKNDGKGDFKRIDFVAKGHSVQFAIEVKWAKKKTLDVKKDFDKLCSFQKCNSASPSFLCVFGKMSDLENLQLKPGSFSERGKAIYADFRRTRYGCRMFELRKPTAP
jgi:Holliday junction resolvase